VVLPQIVDVAGTRVASLVVRGPSADVAWGSLGSWAPPMAFQVSGEALGQVWWPLDTCPHHPI
jgi:hypothetical protein